jgi:hypothetical protein
MSDDKQPKKGVRLHGGNLRASLHAGATVGPAFFVDQTEPTDELDRARHAAAEMERATELLNQTLILAEKKFTELGLGVTTSVSLWVDELDGSEDWLRFGKDGKEWKLTVATTHPNDSPWEVSETPLLSSSRETRTRAMEVLPELFEKLIVEAKLKAEQLNTKLRQTNQFLDKLEAK